MTTRTSVVVLTALVVTLPAATQEKADLLLYNGKVLTVDPEFSIKSAVAVKDGKVLAVGGNELTQRYTAPTRVNLQLAQERWPTVRFAATREHAAAVEV